MDLHKKNQSLSTMRILNSGYTSYDIWEYVKSRVLSFDKEVVQIDLWIWESSWLLYLTKQNTNV